MSRIWQLSSRDNNDMTLGFQLNGRGFFDAYGVSLRLWSDINHTSSCHTEGSNWNWSVLKMRNDVGMRLEWAARRGEFCWVKNVIPLFLFHSVGFFVDSMKFYHSSHTSIKFLLSHFNLLGDDPVLAHLCTGLSELRLKGSLSSRRVARIGPWGVFWEIEAKSDI